MAGAGLTACTGVSNSGSSNGGAGGSNKLRLFTYEDDSTIGLLKAQVATFDQQNGTTTTVDSLPGSGAAVYPDKLRTELLGGSGPDVWRIWGGQIGAPFAKAKQAADLAQYYAKYGWDNKINQNAIAGMTFDGMKAGVPFFLAGVGAWYSKAAFDKAKVTVPQSYAELEEANDKLVAAGVIPCGLGGKYGWDIMRLFEYLLEQSAGPELHDKLLSGAESWDRPEVVTAFTNFKKWQDKKWLPQGALGLDPADIEPGYVQGRTPTPSPARGPRRTAIQSAKKSSSDFGTFQLPTDQQPGAALRLRRGLHDQRQVRQQGQGGRADRLHRPAGHPAGARASPDRRSTAPSRTKTKLPLAYEWSHINKQSRSTRSRTRRSRSNRPTSTSPCRATCCRAR